MADRTDRENMPTSSRTTREPVDSIASAEEFVRLRSSDSADEQRRATHDPAAEEVWLDVIDRFPDYRTWVAHNKTVPLAILKTLSRDRAPEVRFAVAMKRKLDADLFETLSRDTDDGVRARIALNRKTPEHIVTRLLSDVSELVREAAASGLDRR